MFSWNPHDWAKPFAIVRGDNMLMWPFTKLLWILVCILPAKAREYVFTGVGLSVYLPVCP